MDVYGYCMDDPINFHDRTGLAGQSQESKDELAETVINELISTKAPSVTAQKEYKKGNVEGSEIPKSGKTSKSTKHAGADSVKRPSENNTVKHAGADKVDRPPKNKSTKFAGADRHGVPSQHDKKAGADHSSTAPAKKKLAGADRDTGKEKDENGRNLDFGSYVSPEKKEIAINMAKEGHNYGKKFAKDGINLLGPASGALYPVGFSVGALKSIVGDVVIPSISNKLNESKD